jgi:hypothetical protein
LADRNGGYPLDRRFCPIAHLFKRLMHRRDQRWHLIGRT